MWNHDITLLGPKKITGYDVDDNPIYDRVRHETLCIEQSVTRDEFYQASQAGFNPRYTILVNPDEYNNEDLCEYRGEVLTISRAYSPVVFKGLSVTELQLVERIGSHD